MGVRGHVVRVVVVDEGVCVNGIIKSNDKDYEQERKNSRMR
jgi:hypothetical protein